MSKQKLKVDAIQGVNKYEQTSINVVELARLGIKVAEKKSDEEGKSKAEIDKKREEFQAFMSKIRQDIAKEE